jgi:hypothetical protein
MTAALEPRSPNARARWGDGKVLLYAPLPEKLGALWRIGGRALSGALGGGLLYLLLADGAAEGWAALGALALEVVGPALRPLRPGGAEVPLGLGPVLGAAGVGVLWATAGPGLVQALGAAHPALAAALRRARVRELTLRLPLGPGANLSLDTSQADALYPLFVQLSTRVSNHSLRIGRPGSEEEIGDLGKAIESLRGLFPILREGLTAQGPAQAGLFGGPSPAGLVAQAVDGAVRPFLARWHPHWDRWAATGLPEARWPLNKDCRADLEVALRACRRIVAALGTLYGAPTPPDEAPAAAGAAVAADFSPPHPYTHSPVGWGLVIDAAWAQLHRTLIMGLGGIESPSSIPVTPDALRAALQGWRSMVEATSAALSALPLIPPEALLRLSEDDVLERRPDDAMLAYLRALREPLPYLPADPEAPAADAGADELNDVADLLHEAREKLRGLLLQRPGAEDRGPLPSRRAP